MKIAAGMITLLLAALPAVAAASPGAPDPCALPPEVAGWVKAQAGWHVVRLEDLNRDDQDIWRKGNAKDCPGFAAARLDGVRVSYGLILIKTRGGHLRQRVVILRRTARGLIALPQGPSGSPPYPAVVYANLPGPVVPWDDSFHPRRISHAFFTVEQLEAWAVVFYLDGDRIRSVQTSD